MSVNNLRKIGDTKTAPNSPIHQEIELPSRRKILRFDNMYDMFWYEDENNYPNNYYAQFKANPDIQNYLKNRMKFTSMKEKIYREAKSNISKDKDLQKLIHKSKSEKRTLIPNKYGGNFSPVAYARGSEKMFVKGAEGKKAQVLNMAFQVGTFVGGNYQQGFTKILKAILTAQALGIHLNIDVFDSEVKAVSTAGRTGEGYIICNIAKSTERIDINKILVCAHPEFFNFSLFTGYGAQGLNKQYHIGGFIYERDIIKDLSPYYEVIGGNMLRTSSEGTEQKEMINTLIKIAWK